MSDDLDIDPDAVDIGDGLKCAEGQSAVAVVGVDVEDQRVKVYTPTGEYTVNRWVSMDLFSVHRPNEAIQTDADRERWLNETLPRAYTCRDGERQQMDYALDEAGNVQRVVRA
ncbi:hypothetical protein ACODNH_21295 (plasmid) [Haloarcula sp. NS06]|uniref:hypothetical protein n=1 Tax=Haloarcula sp. NS06 TaxID=3409688 RepID=UPI003DA6E9C6